MHGKQLSFDFTEYHTKLGNEGVFIKLRRSPKDSKEPLKVENENDLIKVFASSERLKEDIETSDEEVWLYMRKWVEMTGIEFRGFICNS